MRIIGGEFKGIRFTPSKSFKARPTTDFARENIFNILNNRIYFEDCSVLDLFSGTGAISYEFVSRGCPEIVSIERDPKHHRFICECSKKLEIEHILTPLRADANKYIKSTTKQFDIIFADPPYDLPTIETLPDRILNSKAIKEDTIIIIEHGKSNDFSKHPNFSELRKYGSVHFSILTPTPEVKIEEEVEEIAEVEAKIEETKE